MKISLHRALSELKLMDSKIEKLILEIEPNGLKQKGKLVNGHYQEDDFSKHAQSKFQAVNDLIERKVKIKAAVVKANAETMVTIGEREMTIADAITYKSIIAYQKSLMDSLKSKFARTKKRDGNEEYAGGAELAKSAGSYVWKR